MLRAVSEAAASDARLNRDWTQLVKGSDAIGAARIEQQQAAGFSPDFPALPVAIALNQFDSALLIDQFGRRPRGNPGVVLQALTRIWVSTLQGPQALQ